MRPIGIPGIPWICRGHFCLAVPLRCGGAATIVDGMECHILHGKLFDDPAQPAAHQVFAPDAVLLRGFGLENEAELIEGFEAVVGMTPLRYMLTPGGRRMSVLNTNAGPLGWVSDRAGYRYQATDPLDGESWPPLPPAWRNLACRAARAAGFDGFEPDACLVNVYEPGARLSLHQDRDERDFSAPIVSVSLGLPAVFLFGGRTRAARVRRLPLLHGDVLVWGGASRLAFHGVAPLAEGVHPLLGCRRINLTLRRAT